MYERKEVVGDHPILTTWRNSLLEAVRFINRKKEVTE
jgi:hypothetical protein